MPKRYVRRLILGPNRKKRESTYFELIQNADPQS